MLFFLCTCSTLSKTYAEFMWVWSANHVGLIEAVSIYIVTQYCRIFWQIKKAFPDCVGVQTAGLLCLPKGNFLTCLCFIAFYTIQYI